jgi:hypothetical protein
VGDVVVRFELVDGAGARAAEELTPAVTAAVADTGFDVVVGKDDESLRLDPESVAAAVGGVTIILSSASLTLAGASKMLDQLAGVVRSATGVKKAVLELFGKDVPVEQAQPEDVVAEATE